LGKPERQSSFKVVRAIIGDGTRLSYAPYIICVGIALELMASMASVFDFEQPFNVRKVVGLLLWTIVFAGLFFGVRAVMGRGAACDLCRVLGLGS